MNNNETNQIIKYLNSIIFDLKFQEEPPKEFEENSEFVKLYESVKSIRLTIQAFGKGDLSSKIEGNGYTLGLLKNLQAALKNLIWQTNTMASGDFSQKTDFLGEFSDAFNNMANKLEASVNDLKESKELFELFFQTIPDATLITKLEDGQIFAYNHAFLELSGYDDDELENAKVTEIGFYQSLEQRNELISELNRHGFSKNLELTVQSKNKETIQTLYSSQVITIKEKQYILSIIKDITLIKKYEEEIVKLSITDKLTQIYNRLKLDETLKREFERSKRSDQPYSVIIIDIDYFKLVNDNYGHQMGDQVLVEFARMLRENIRMIDTIGRWGGEEFLVILPETDEEGALSLAEKLRDIINKHSFGRVGPITASFGVAISADDINEDELITRADEALYLAKNNGRNRVEIIHKG